MVCTPLCNSSRTLFNHGPVSFAAGGEVTTPRFTQYFRGSLSGLTIRPGKIETQKVISCLQACKEGLDINSLESLGKGIKFHFNPAQSVLVMEGDDLESINTAMAKVSYINSRQFPTPGLRKLRVTTTVQCFGEDTCISIPDIKAVVMVLPPSEPRITIAGVERVMCPAAELRTPTGVSLFKDIRIISTVTKSDSAFSSGHRPGVLEVMHNLDYCDVLVIGEELNPDHESLEIHHSSLLGKHLDATNSTSGISIYGVDSMAHYEQAIRQVRYHNWRPAGLSERKFRLSCSELNGRYTSNEFNLEVSVCPYMLDFCEPIAVVHSSEAVEHVNHMAVQSQYMRPVHHPLVVHTVNSDHISGTPPAATVVIVMCIAALVVIVVLGIYRIHTTHQEGTKGDEDGGKDPEMDWDDSTLTITVNPMENIEGPQSAGELRGEELEEEDEDDEEDEEELAGDRSSAESEDSEEEEQTEVMGKAKGKLEWDPSSLPCGQDICQVCMDPETKNVGSDGSPGRLSASSLRLPPSGTSSPQQSSPGPGPPAPFPAQQSHPQAEEAPGLQGFPCISRNGHRQPVRPLSYSRTCRDCLNTFRELQVHVLEEPGLEGHSPFLEPSGNLPDAVWLQ
ncbi:hypothetical protein NFI96_010502 [Prochilodus magdalenae]|nr:hypothetical protein NFI96_010502 [Prochilodus magdalenae]